MQLMFEQTASALASAIDAKDKYTHGHSSRVAIYSEKIAKLSGKNAEECQDIFFSALLHDVGKIGIPDKVLNKEGKLTDEEFAIIKTHPVIGQQILSSIWDSPSLSIVAHHHHERYDGRGYPDGLKGEDIPETARIISVADAYDAMTSKRSYRDPMPQHIVREEIVKGSGTQFDPEYASAMLHLIDLDTEYEMIEKEESTTVSDSSELVCAEMRSVISNGVLITESFSEIIFTGKVIDMDKLNEDSLPTLILFDSLDGKAHDTDYLRKITNYFEYGTIRIDGKCDCPGVRKIKSTVTELDTITPQEYRQDMEKGIRYTIDAVRFKDHVLIRLVTWFKKIELTIAMPDSTRFAYIALTGSNTVMSAIQINRTDTDISADYITRIAEKISYINVPQGDIPNVQIDGWRKAATSGIPVHDGMKITFHTMSLPTARLIWHCPFIDLFYSDNCKIAGENYREFALIRLDGESWEADEKAENKMRYSLTDEFKGWDDWKERNKQGLEGRYNYADAPDDIFRRHDNCTCTVTYECGKMRQDVWSKRTWQASDKELEQRKALSEASKPTVNTPEQAKELEKQILEKNPVTKLTPEQAKAIDEQSKSTVNTPEQAKEIEQQKLMQEQNYVITEKNESNDYSVNRQIVNSKEYHDKFESITPHKKTNEKLYQQSKRLLENRDGRDSERMIALDSRTGSFIVDNLESGIDQSFRTGFTKEQYDLIQSNQGNVILLHNHPGSLRPSGTDILTLWREEKVDASIIVGHDGSVCSISKINRKIPLDKIYEDAYNKYIEEGFPKSYAALKATDKLYETDAFVYIKR